MKKNKGIKNLLKSILRITEPAENKENIIPQPACVGNTDFFSYEDGILYAEGWVFDPEYTIDHGAVVFYRENQKITAIPYGVVYRKDVAEILNDLRAEASGFFFEAAVRTAADLKVLFEYDTSAGKGSFFLGKITGDPTWKGECRVDSLTKENCIGNIRYVREYYDRMSPDSDCMRLFAKLKWLEREKDVPTILAFDHFLGGGASEYLDEKKRAALEKGYRFLTLRQDTKGPTYYLSYEYGEYRILYYEKELERVFQPICRIDSIWINELVTYASPYIIMRQILKLKGKYQARLRMLLHDYYAMCPAVNLMNDQGIYCQGASEEICNQCIPNNRSNACTEYESGSVWREKWGGFLEQCDEIYAFSEDTARLFQQVYPGLDKLKVVPHKPHDLPLVKKQRKTTSTFNIGLLGVLCYKKGLEVVKKLVQYIEKEDLNVRIRLIGVSDEEICSPVFSYTGRYTLEQLPELTLENDVDMFLIPSIWPETFSYTTSEVISMGFPVAVFPIGAPVERVKKYDKGLILSGMEPEVILSEMRAFAAKVLEPAIVPANEKEN